MTLEQFGGALMLLNALLIFGSVKMFGLAVTKQRIKYGFMLGCVFAFLITLYSQNG